MKRGQVELVERAVEVKRDGGVERAGEVKREEQVKREGEAEREERTGIWRKIYKIFL